MAHLKGTKCSCLILFMLALSFDPAAAIDLPATKYCIPPAPRGAISFWPPRQAQIFQALGPVQALPHALQKAFHLSDDFRPMTFPQPGDWLAVHPEEGQPFEDFIRCEWNRPDRTRNKIYLQPLGEFLPGPSPPLDRLQEWAAAYFTLEVKVQPVLRIDHQAITSRLNPLTNHRQLLVDDLLALLGEKLPADAFCLLGITNEDLYPNPEWNFVFGMATLRARVGIISLARYDPSLYGEPRSPDFQRRLLKRTGKVMIHEIGHMCGLLHCIYCKCIMNGSNHLPEGDLRPPHLCPVCLRKLHHALGFDVGARYRQLLKVYQKCGFESEAGWVEKRLERITGDN
ncbi:MAG: archaemetzincin [Desulfobacteraceae bacterium]